MVGGSRTEDATENPTQFMTAPLVPVPLGQVLEEAIGGHIMSITLSRLL